jgi:hypothetical protein
MIPSPVTTTRRGAIRQAAGVAEPIDVSGGAAARSFLTPSTTSLTVRMERTSSSGIEILKAFSSSKSSVKTSSEDAEVLQIGIERIFRRIALRTKG